MTETYFKQILKWPQKSTKKSFLHQRYTETVTETETDTKVDTEKVYQYKILHTYPKPTPKSIQKIHILKYR